jgi:[ribosomal protein S18]-alanine N-acetyltransferase
MANVPEMTNHAQDPGPFSVSIRPSLPTDIKAISSLDFEAFHHDLYPMLFFRQAFDLWPTLFPVAETANGTIIGYAIGAISENPSTGWILVLAVASEVRHRGIGTSLAINLLEAMAKHGVRDVWLTVEPNNFAAIHTFKNLGFEIVHHDESYFGPDRPRYVMTLTHLHQHARQHPMSMES